MWYTVHSRITVYGSPVMGLSPVEIVVVALVVVLLFGTKRLPELGSGLGKAISNFRKGYKDGTAIDVTPKDEEKSDTTDSSKN